MKPSVKCKKLGSLVTLISKTAISVAYFFKYVSQCSQQSLLQRSVCIALAAAVVAYRRPSRFIIGVGHEFVKNVVFISLN
jgi:hypothetical protein